jgi:hypothetical protein
MPPPSASRRSSAPTPFTIQAADLPQALATGLISALMTSAATGYDVKVWDRMGYFYDCSPLLTEGRGMVTSLNEVRTTYADREFFVSMTRLGSPSGSSMATPEFQ